MNANEFYFMLKEYARKEMFEQGQKAADASVAGEVAKSQMHQGASNEAAKFYSLIESAWLDVQR